MGKGIGKSYGELCDRIFKVPLFASVGGHLSKMAFSTSLKKRQTTGLCRFCIEGLFIPFGLAIVIILF